MERRPHACEEVVEKRMKKQWYQTGYPFALPEPMVRILYLKATLKKVRIHASNKN